jgi:hypothetical protein
MIFSKFSVAFAIVGLVLVHSQTETGTGTESGTESVPDASINLFIQTDALGKQFDIRTHCAADCPLSSKGNWQCDNGCVCEACGWDLDDCRGKYACRDCEWWRIGNGKCDPQCNFKEGECYNDKDECNEDKVDPAIYCAKDCLWRKLDDKQCDLGCYKESCKFDYGDCGREPDLKCAENCLNRQINNDICEPGCKVKGCEFDWDDCGKEFSEHCSKDCVKGLLGDKKCDLDCLSEACEYDRGDCECAPGCHVLYERDGICQEACKNVECKFDDYDCECAPGCTKEMVENNVYDSACKFDTCVLEFVKLRMIATQSYTDIDSNLILELANNVKLTVGADGTVTEGVINPDFNPGTGGSDGGL